MPPANADPAPGRSIRSPRSVRLDVRSGLYLTVAALGALALVAVVRASNAMLTRVGIGFVIALALDPIVARTSRRLGGRRGLAVVVVGVSIMILTTVLVAVLGPPAVEQAAEFSDELPAALEELEELPLVGGWLERNDFKERAQEWVDNAPTEISNETIEQGAEQLLDGVAGMIMVVLVAVGVLADGETMIARVRRTLRPDHRAQADQAGRVLYRSLGNYFGGSVTVAVLMGIYVLALGLALGIPLVPIAAVWAMLTDLIPQIGGFLGGAFFVLLAFTKSPATAVIAGILFVLYMNIENHLIGPAIVGASVDLTPPTTMLAAFIGGAVAGIPGALVATPLVGATKRFYLDSRGRARPEVPHGPGRLRALLAKRVKRLAPRQPAVSGPRPSGGRGG